MFGVLLACVTPAMAGPSTLPLMPQPQSVTVMDPATRSIAGGIRIDWTQAPSPLLRRAEQRFVARLRNLAGRAAEGAPLTLHITTGHDPAYLSVDEKEGYTLSTSAPDGIYLSAAGPAGVLHGLATLLQLVELTPQGAVLGHVDIQDSPVLPGGGS
ncbi:glycoside hydrolase family 20 zincin-like fold domain-containing protein [Komagataeibacter nataicola]|uniref:glycoside hydrolase family 20 zincin-like fold domain-containing protein n=1 Tax=Komagataeibacter nataicola TaxID=265960 RepID=UPI0028A9F07C|nr:glycoside hydrolase family 20 zincin-like fold domain-containing protein [Komagataeibacter nataicola]WNM08606.1 glycoside hydrolase family 20 zincin-like fold domain-containing protein [Komagataeibacter nataicola]